MKFTQGEWTIEGNAGQLAIVYNNRALAFIPAYHPDAEANAKLISAAPIMLQALIALKTANGSNNFDAEFGEAIKLANEAINKAIG